MANTISGACRYCGQIYLIPEEDIEPYENGEVAGEIPADLTDWLATLRCDCDGARCLQRVEETKEQTKANIDILYSEDYPEAAELLKKVADMIAEGKAVSIKLQIGKRTAATMARNAKGEVKVKRTITKSDELSS